MRNFNQIILSLLILTTACFLYREWEVEQSRKSYRAPLTVYLRGQVVRAGPVTLPQGSRLLHAIHACGGVTEQADLENLQMVSYLRDGESITIPNRENISDKLEPREGERVVPGDKLGSGKLVLNTAGPRELESLPGIGPKLAERIVLHRRKRKGGTFCKLEDLTAIRGINKKTVVRLKPYLELEAHDKQARRTLPRGRISGSS